MLVKLLLIWRSGWFRVVVTALLTSTRLSYAEPGNWLRPFWRVYHSNIFPVPFSLAFPPWEGAINTDDDFSHCWERNGKSCPPKQRSLLPGLLAYWLNVQAVNLSRLFGRLKLYARLIKSTPCLLIEFIKGMNSLIYAYIFSNPVVVQMPKHLPFNFW